MSYGSVSKPLSVESSEDLHGAPRSPAPVSNGNEGARHEQSTCRTRRRSAYRPRLRAASSLLVALISIVPSSAAAADWASGTFTVESIEAASGGWTWVSFDRNHGLASLCVTNDNKALIPAVGNNGTTAEGQRSVLQMVSIALTAGKSVRLRLERVPNNNYCYIERVTLLRN